MHVEKASRQLERQVLTLARRQHGVVSRGQLLEIGLGRGAIVHRLQQGRLHVVHRGVYAVGRADLPPKGHMVAAMLASGLGTVLSHRSAAWLWNIGPNPGFVELTAPRRLRGRPGIQAHANVLRRDEITIVDGISVTTVVRAIFDLAAVSPRHQLERAFREAEYRRLTDVLSLDDLIERYPTRRGVPALKAISADRQLGEGITRSELEDRFLAFLDAHHLPRSRSNHRLNLANRWIEVDYAWPAENLVVELDGRAAHDTASAFERDRERDRALATAGWTVVRVTWRQLEHSGNQLARDLRRLLT